ncbi:class I SAM-dependent DNA methyltransferase [Saccharospirillum alexandrii]|uniref:class I SAM-dependent DNA methyltransferase n=1 Tax=Saccharospirillum alexandrii TaxID=2448477 RepID=UPI0037365633
MDDSWDKYADGWDSNPAVIAYADNAYHALRNTLDPDGWRILDFGCGSGLLTERLSDSASSIVALDPSQKMIETLDAKHLKDVVTIASELDQNVILNNSHLASTFDLIVASSALAFVSDYTETLKLLKQVLRRGGYLVQWDWYKKEGDEGYGFTEQQVQLAMTEAGFSTVSTSIPFSMKGEGSTLDVIMGVAINDS